MLAPTTIAPALPPSPDTLLLLDAIAALDGRGELLLEPREYSLNRTLAIGAGIAVRGASRSQTRLLMTADLDLFRTVEADRLLKLGGVNTNYFFDEDISFRDLTIEMPPAGRLGSAIVVRQPGEGNALSGLHINGGAAGIRCLGMGAPGLRLRDCTTSNQLTAGVWIQGYVGPNNEWAGYGGPMSIIGLSGDCRRPDAWQTASLLFIDGCYGPHKVECLKAEGDFGGGVIRYRFAWDTPGNANVPLAGIKIECATANVGANVKHCDFLVLEADGSQCPLAELSLFNPYGCRATINDKVNKVLLRPTTPFLQGVRPLYYP